MVNREILRNCVIIDFFRSTFKRTFDANVGVFYIYPFSDLLYRTKNDETKGLRNIV